MTTEQYIIERHLQNPDVDYQDIVFWDYVCSSKGSLFASGFPQPMSKNEAEETAKKAREKYSSSFFYVKPIK